MKPNLSYHFVAANDDGRVLAFNDIVQSGLRVNGGFFAFKTQIFDYVRDGEELVLEPFQRLVEDRELLAYPYDGFWMAMDTAKMIAVKKAFAGVGISANLGHEPTNRVLALSFIRQDLLPGWSTSR